MFNKLIINRIINPIKKQLIYEVFLWELHKNNLNSLDTGSQI